MPPEPHTFISTVNRMKIATLTTSSAAAGFGVDNLKEPEHIGLPWRSIGTANTTITIDLGGALSVTRTGFIDANFQLIRIQQNTSDIWTSPPFDTLNIPVVLDREKVMYRRWYDPTVNLPSVGTIMNRQFTRIFIPAQATTDGASYFSMGGIWMGTFTALPRGCQPGFSRQIVDPRDIRTAALGKWTKVIRTGDPYVVHRFRRQALRDLETPGIGDEIEGWQLLDRSIRSASAAGLFCYCVGVWGDGAVYVGRQLHETNWEDNELSIERDDWVVTEAVAG